MSKPFMRKLNPFKPTDIGGCVLWLDGADSSKITLGSGSNVSTWIDKSSLANNFTNTNTTSPTKTTTPGGYPCVYLNGSTCQMTSVSNNSTTGNSSRTVIMISQTGAGGDSRFGTGPHGGASPPNTYGIDLAPIANIIFCPYVYTGSDVTAYGVPNTNMYSLYSYYNSSTSTVGGIVNFTLTASNSTTLNTSATPWYLGLRPDGGYSTAAYVCEIIQYNLILTTAQRQQLEGYLAQKWGMQANLPAGSPGRTGVIYPRTLLIDSLTTGQPTRLPFIRPRAILNYIGFTITGSTAASATNYQIPITVYRSIGTNTGSSVYLGTDIYSDYSNLYFLASNQATILSFYIESGTQTSASARIWVSVPSIPASPSTTKVYIYWNMSGTYTSPSSGTSTFPSLFDDFNGTAGSAPNASKWSVQLKGTSTSSSVQLNGSGEVILTPTENSISSASLLSLNTIPANGFSIYIRRKYTTGTYPDTSFATTNTLVDSDYSLTSSWWHTTLGGGYVLFYQSPSNIVVRRQPTYTGSTQSATDIITPTISTSINTYEIVEIQYSTAGIINFIWNGVNKGTTTDTTFLSGGKYVLISQGNYTGIFNNVETVDYVFVRSYLNPEPSVTAWGSINTL